MNYAPLMLYIVITCITPGPNNIMCMYLGAHCGLRGARKFMTASIAMFFIKMLLCGILNVTLADVLQDSFCMEDTCETQDDIRRMRQLLDGLPARERQIILLRYGLSGQPPLTQLETAKLLDISRSYVSRLETHALELLRQRWDVPGTKTAQR